MKTHFQIPPPPPHKQTYTHKPHINPRPRPMFVKTSLEIFPCKMYECCTVKQVKESMWLHSMGLTLKVPKLSSRSAYSDHTLSDLWTRAWTTSVCTPHPQGTAKFTCVTVTGDNEVHIRHSDKRQSSLHTSQ